MKALRILTLLLFVLPHTVCFSQKVKMTKEVEQITKLGKDAIVQMALELIDKEVSLDNFARNYVLTDGKEIFVSLRNPIKYLPIASVFYFDIVVHLLGKQVSYDPMSNPYNSYEQEEIPFYTQTEEAEKNIQFVVESINKSKEVGSFDIENFEDTMIIKETEKYYDITIVSAFQESMYKIEKESGRIYDATHAHLEPDPDEREVIFKEIH